MTKLTLKALEEFKQRKKSKLIDTLINVSQETIRLIPEHVDTEEDIPIGTSKYWGNPDLPEELSWPHNEEKPLAFLAQINCAELALVCESNLFPKSGIIYFFYDFHKMTWGFDPKDKGSWKVMYSDGEKTKLTRKSSPDNVYPIDFYIPKELTYYEPRKLGFELDISIPFPYSRASENTELDDLGESEDEEYWEIIETVDKAYEKLGADHRILGCPMQIQGDMELECQLVSNGLYCGDSTGYNDPKAKELEDGADDWKLLLQLGSEDDEEGMMWGDSGFLFFWIKEQDLKERSFEKSWCVLQCH